MNGIHRRSIRLVLMSWAVFALGLLAIAVGYLLYDLSARQFESDWTSRIRQEVSNLHQQLAYTLSQEDLAQADRIVALMATKTTVKTVLLVESGTVLLSTRRSLIGEAYNSDTMPGRKGALRIERQHQQWTVSSELLYYRAGSREPQLAWLMAQYDLSYPHRLMLQQAGQKFLVVLALMALFVFGMARLIRHHLLQPLNLLGRYAEQLQHHPDDSRLPHLRIREFHAIGAAFQQLSEHLQHSLRQVQHRQSLERAFSETFPDNALVIDERGIVHERFGNSSLAMLDDLPELIGLPFWNWIEETQQKRVIHCWRQALQSQRTAVESFQHEGYFLESRMTPFSLDSSPHSSHQHVLWVIRDMTELRQKQIEIEYRAHYDPLTNLGNRQFALNTVEAHLNRARENEAYGAILFVDLDHFKKINDSMGHSVGDAILREAAFRLKACSNPSDYCTRLGGDEFLLIMENLADSAASIIDEATNVASRVLDTFRQPFRFERHTFHLSASVGIAVFPMEQLGASDLVRQADTAMYYAKANGRNGWSIYNEHMQQESQDRLNLVNELHDAIIARSFSLVMQPQIDSENRLTGAEVLCRWVNNGRPVAPDIFIAAAEEANLIVDLGDWIMSESLRLLRHWQDQEWLPSSFERLAINISPSQFLHPNFLDRLMLHCGRYHIDPNRVELEITEGVFVNDRFAVRTLMQQLVDKGFAISLDDFGTGYSSLSYLQSLPIQTLKIDRSFVTHLDEIDGNSNIVDYIIRLANSLSVDIIAEGVENEAQRDCLIQLGCQRFQGYLFSKPLTAADFIDFTKTLD